MRKVNIICWLFLIFFIISMFSCKKNRFYEDTDANLKFSTHLVTFDTIFTSISSITRQLKVYNPYNATIKTDIALIGGNASYYSININGQSAVALKNVEIAAKDSIFILIKVNIPPNGANTPILLSDTLTFFTNGNRQNVELLAFGQDANFIIPNAVYAGNIHGKIVAHEGETISWTKEKPYVIYGYAIVDSTATLIIEPGTQIYLHKGAGIWAYKGACIIANGTFDEPIVFQGDRKEEWYQKDFSQWDRIWLCESDKNHIFNYTIITNAYIGIQAETLQKSMGNQLILTNSILKKSEMYCLFSRGYNISAANNIIVDAKQYCVYLSAGGYYNFFNNTISDKNAGDINVPAVMLSNYNIVQTAIGNSTYYGDFHAQMINNIIYGNDENEINSDAINEAEFNLQVDNCLIKVRKSRLDSLNLNHNNLIFNANPLFTDPTIDIYDFSLNNASPCKGAGKFISNITTDFAGNIRNNPPSIGAFE